MIKKTITYTDYNGNQRTEDYYFNLNVVELAELQPLNINDKQTLSDPLGDIKTFKEFILKSYGEKSADGRMFVKSEEASKNFSQSEAFNALFTEFIDDTTGTKIMNFINGILPANLVDEQQN